MLIPNKFNGYFAGRRTCFGGGAQSAGGNSPAGAEGIDGIGISGVTGSPGDFGGGSDTGSGVADLLSALSDKTSQPMLSPNYTPQDGAQRQFYQPVYKPSYQDYNQGNPLAVSSYGQDYVSPFGQFQNPFRYSPQSYSPVGSFDDYGMQFEGMTSPNYGIAGLYR
jgi:hypothetical protein